MTHGMSCRDVLILYKLIKLFLIPDAPQNCVEYVETCWAALVIQAEIKRVHLPFTYFVTKSLKNNNGKKDKEMDECNK